MKKVNFKHGAGEIIGMAVTLPLVIVLILLVVNLFQISRCEQRLIYASYFCGRSAAISFNQEEAENAVTKVLSDLNAKDGSDIRFDKPIDVHGAWLKGNFVIVNVYEDLHPILGIGGGTHYRRIAMLIEHSEWIQE